MEFQASLTTAFPNDTNFTDGTLPKTLSAVTASLSLMGSFTIFLTFWMSPDLRTTPRRMIMFVTVADFLFAGTTIVDYLEDRLGSTGYFVRALEVTIPRIMALVSSLIWTVHLSFFFYLTICRRMSMESERLFLMFFHITAWGVPFVITVVAYSSTEFNYWQTLKLDTSAGSGMKKLGRQCASGQLLQERAGPS